MDRAMRARFRLRHLEVFHWVMEENSVTAAAASLRSSQPSVSRDLAEFERILGKPLFVRQGRKLVPTAEAEILHGEIRKSYMCADALFDLCDEIVAGKAGHIRIASVPSIALNVVPRAIHRMIAAGFQFTVDLETHSRDHIHDELRKGSFDIGFTVLGGYDQDLLTEQLTSVEAVCAFNPRSPLRDLRIVTPADLVGEKFISLAPTYMSRHKVDEAMLRAGIALDVFMTTQTAISACGLIRSGLGAAILDPFTVAAASSDELIARPFAPKIEFDYIIVRPLHRGNDILVGQLSQAVRQVVAEVLGR